MAAPVDTNVSGEGDESNPKSIESWMKQHSFNLSPDTYTKLAENGFTTIDQLKLMQSSEIVEAAKEMQIKLADRFALKRARDKLGDKKIYIDPEELSIINSIDLKIKTFENKLNDVNGKEKNMQNEKERIEHEINTTFKTLTNALNDRKQELLEKLNSIISKKNDEIKERENDMNESLDAIKKYKNDTDNLMDAAISLNELKDRKLKIQQNEQEIDKIIKQNNKRNSMIIDEKVYFVLNAKNALQFICGLGSISDIIVPILTSLQYDDNNPNGIIKIGWKIDAFDDNKEDDKNERKIGIEYSLIDDNENKENDVDDNKENWISKDFDIDSKTNERIENIPIEKIGVYIFKMRQFHKSSWSQYSNIKSITVKNIKVFDSKILKENEVKILTKWMNEKLINNGKNQSIKYNLLYRMTRDGKETNNFYTKCNNKGATLTIYHSEYNHVFGGYASLSWSNTGSYKKDDDSFIYLLRSQFGHHPQIYTNTEPQNAVFHYNSYGPSFGRGVDLAYNLQSEYDMYFYPEKSYKIKGNTLCGGSSYDASATTKGYHTCFVKEYEVFQITL